MGTVLVFTSGAEVGGAIERRGESWYIIADDGRALQARLLKRKDKPMPIRREEYAENWEAISRRIRFERAGGRCERCGVAHGAVGARDANGVWRDAAEIEAMTPAALGEFYPTLASRRLVTMYLTVAHLTRNPADNGEFALACYCTHCHLDYDRQDNWQRRRRNRLARWLAAGQMALGRWK